MSLAQKAFSGFVWTLFSRIGTRFSIFVVGIILARLLTPADFGLVAMLGVFFAISNSLVDSGFTQALIRERHISQEDKNTVFSINTILSVLMYSVLWFSSPYIASFFNQPALLWLTRVMGLDILFKAISIVQRAVLMNTLNFKLLSKIDISVSVITGIISIYLAFKGLGIWALAIKYFLSSLFVSVMFYIVNPWKPSGFINKDSFRRMFAFGSNMLLTGLINNIFVNIYNLIIGKFFSATILGFYNRAFIFADQFSSTILIALGQVTYPILSKSRDDKTRLRAAYKKILMSSSFINFPLSLFLLVAAEPFILVLLGEKWIDSVPFLRILSLSMLVSYFVSLNHNMLKVIGRSDMFLKLSLFNKALTVVAVLIGLKWGVYYMVVGSIIVVYAEAFVSILLISKFLGYRFVNQMKDTFKNFALSMPMLVVILILSNISFETQLIKLLILSSSSAVVYLLTGRVFKASAYLQIKELILITIKSKFSIK